MKWHRSIVLALAMLALALMAPDVASEPPEPEGWVYGETSLSGLSLEEKVRLLGVAEGLAPPKAMRRYAEYSYPSEIDWRDKFGGDYTTSVKDQGACGSCVAFAVAASIESRLEVRLNAPSLNPDLSEADMFYCGCGSCCGRDGGITKHLTTSWLMACVTNHASHTSTATFLANFAQAGKRGR